MLNIELNQGRLIISLNWLNPRIIYRYSTSNTSDVTEESAHTDWNYEKDWWEGGWDDSEWGGNWRFDESDSYRSHKYLDISQWSTPHMYLLRRTPITQRDA